MCCFTKTLDDLEFINDDYSDATDSVDIAATAATDDNNRNNNNNFNDYNFDSNVNFSTLKAKNVLSDMEPIGDEISMFSDRIHDRSKRTLIFRPLMVYRQQKIRKIRLDAKRRLDQQTNDDNTRRRKDANPTFYTQFINPTNQLPCRYGHH